MPDLSDTERIEVADAEQHIENANEESEAVVDSLFPPNPHVTVVIEEPEAHLHPQLQHGLTRHLRRVVERRPELQVILTTHSSEIISAASTRELVVLKRVDKKTVSRSPLALPISEKERDRVLLMADRHLDATRSATLFATVSVVVEGITDALLLRKFGYLWAGDDHRRERFIDSLTITLAGGRIGNWIPQLLATRGYEIVERLAILGDADKIGEPKWLDEFDPKHVQCFLSEPTLEPSLVPDNLPLVQEALKAIGATLPVVTVDTVTSYFGKDGPGRSKKAGFAEAVVDLIDSGNVDAQAPAHIANALNFLWEGATESGHESPADNEGANATPPTD